MDLRQLVGHGQADDINKTSQLARMIPKSFATHVFFTETQRLHHRPHGTVEHEHSSFQLRRQQRCWSCFVSRGHKHFQLKDVAVPVKRSRLNQVNLLPPHHL